MKKNVFVVFLTTVFWLLLVAGFWLPDSLTHNKVCHDDELKTWFLIYGYTVILFMYISAYLVIRHILNGIINYIMNDEQH